MSNFKEFHSLQPNLQTKLLNYLCRIKLLRFTGLSFKKALQRMTVLRYIEAGMFCVVYGCPGPSSFYKRNNGDCCK